MIKRYAGDKITGLSSDTKPTTVNEGATFHETDTKALFVYDGSAWVQQVLTSLGDVNLTSLANKDIIQWDSVTSKWINYNLPDPIVYKGVIAVAADFPTSALVKSGWLYFVTANVTDNDVTKTNTGLSFLAGDEIVWDGSTWNNIGSTALWSRTGTTLSPVNVGDNISTSGSFYSLGLTQGSIPFLGATGLITEDNSNLFWNNTDKRLGIGTTTPTYLLNLKGVSSNAILKGESTTGTEMFLFNTVSGNTLVKLFNSTGTENIRLDTSGNTYFNGGNVGIGITNPQRGLEISTGTSASDDILRLSEFANPTERYMEIGSARITVTRMSGSSAGLRLSTKLFSGTWGTNGGFIGFFPREVETMRITHTGDVGIGTVTPLSRLQIESSSFNLMDVFRSGLSADTGLWRHGILANGTYYFSTRRDNGNLLNVIFSLQRDGKIGIGTDTPSQLLELSATSPALSFLNTASSNKLWRFSSTVNDFTVVETGVAEVMRFQAGGNVGIGNVNPAHKLDVTGNINVSSGNIYLSQAIVKADKPSWSPKGRLAFTPSGLESEGLFVVQKETGITPSGQQDLLFQVLPTGTATPDGSWSIFESWRAPLWFGTGTLSSILDDVIPIIFATNRIERMRLTSDGYLGIGTTTPTEKLDVVGNIKSSGIITTSDLRTVSNGTITRDVNDDISTIALADRTITITRDLNGVITSYEDANYVWTLNRTDDLITDWVVTAK